MNQAPWTTSQKHIHHSRGFGGKECRRFTAMPWKETDPFMAKPENAAVRERYEKHLASVGAKCTSSIPIKSWRRPVPSQLLWHRVNLLSPDISGDSGDVKADDAQ